jgi:hypothetical protein
MYSRAGNARELLSTCGMPLANTSLDFHPKHAAFLHASHLQALAASLNKVNKEIVQK